MELLSETPQSVFAHGQHFLSRAFGFTAEEASHIRHYHVDVEPYAVSHGCASRLVCRQAQFDKGGAGVLNVSA